MWREFIYLSRIPSLGNAFVSGFIIFVLFIITDNFIPTVPHYDIDIYFRPRRWSAPGNRERNARETKKDEIFCTNKNNRNKRPWWLRMRMMDDVNKWGWLAMKIIIINRVRWLGWSGHEEGCYGLVVIMPFNRRPQVDEDDSIEEEKNQRTPFKHTIYPRKNAHLRPVALCCLTKIDVPTPRNGNKFSHNDDRPFKFEPKFKWFSWRTVSSL